jgi:hypothetical protein
LHLALHRTTCHPVSYLRYQAILALNYTAHYHKVSNPTHETTSNALHRRHSCMLATPAGKFITPLLAFISLNSDMI